MQIAFIGMGIMGSAMAANCLKAGHSVTVFNRTAAKCEPLRELGAEVAATPALAARGAEAVLICVEDTSDVEAVIFGPEGIVHGLVSESAQVSSRPIVIDHSTISPEATEAFAGYLREQTGCDYLDAPVSGGDVGARAGTLAIMVGGPSVAFERARPVLEAMGKTIVHIGERNGDGQRCKMINQLLVAIHSIATTEAMRLGEALGMDMPRVLEAIGQGAAGSWSLNNLGPKYLARDFKPGFRLKHLLKDAGFCSEAIDALHNTQGTFPGIMLARQRIEQGVDAGFGEENIHAVGKLKE